MQIIKLNLGCKTFVAILGPVLPLLIDTGTLYIRRRNQLLRENAKKEVGWTFYNEFAITNVPVKSKLQHPPPGQPPGHLNF